MSQVSRHPLSKASYERIFEILFEAVLKIQNKNEAEDFLSDFLTPTEKIVLAKRISVAVLLAKDYDYRTIRSILHVSPPTIASVNTAMKYNQKGYRQVVDRLLKEEKLNNFLLSVAETVAKIGSVGGKGSADWRKVKQYIGRKRHKNPF